MLNQRASYRHNSQIALTYFVYGVFLLLIIIAIFFFNDDDMVSGMATLAFPFAFIVIVAILTKPRFGIITILFANYFAIGISRYINLPTGLMVDIFLVLTLASVFFSQLNKKVEWEKAGKDITYLVLFWFLVTALQLLNPETVSRTAWFYAMRSMALYSAIIVPLVYIVFDKPKDLLNFIYISGIFTILAILKAIQQKFFGPDPWELIWLSEPGNTTTHILFGILRVFSFYSDAGTFGGMMGYFGVLFLILAVHVKGSFKQKIFFIATSAGSFYSMALSGTRSAVAVPFVGFFVYAFLTKNFKVLITTGFILLGALIFLKFTTYGQGIYEIRRMRTIFEEKEPSLVVRQENRALFRKYLERRPFGGGVGSAGNWGRRFTPETFLAQTATDGWYIQVWVEQGIVGLGIYMFMILYITIKAALIILFKLKDNNYRYIAIAFLSSAFGIMVSSYSASTLGQMPGTILFFISMCFIFMMPDWEKKKLFYSSQQMIE